MDFIYLFRVLLRKKWIILFLSLFAAISAFVLMMFKKDMHESVAQYSTGFTAEKVKLSDGSVAVDIYTLDIKFNNVIETFMSQRVIGMVSYKLMLHDLENPAKPFRRLSENDKKSEEFRAVSTDTAIKILTNKIISGDLLSPSDKTDQKIIEFLKLYEYDYDGLKKELNIHRVERTDYLDIIYQSENPDLSAYVVNTLGTEFINYYKNFNDQRTSQSAENIQQLVKLQQQKVDSLTNELKIARISQGALDPVEQSKNAMETTKELQIQYSGAQNEYNLQSRLYENYSERLKTVNSLIGNTGGQDALKLFQRRDELRESISKSTTPDPDLVKELDNVEAQIKSQAGSGTNKTKLQAEASDLQTKAGEAKARMNAAATTLSQLERLIAASKGISNVSPKTQVEIDAIEKRLEIENSELKSIREKLSQAEGLKQDDPTANFRQTLIGEPDIKPVPKRKILTTGLAGISVFIISCLVFLLIEIFSSAIKTSSQFSKMINLNLRGVLNIIRFKKYSIEELILNDFQGPKFKKEELFKNNIRKLRHEIDSTHQQVFLFTSTSRSVGKTMLLQALAFSFLRSNKKILLIDLNFENNEISKIFEAELFIEDVAAYNDVKMEYVRPEKETSAVTETTYLLEEDSPKYEIQPYQIETSTITSPHYNLFVLGCRGGNHTPSEIISMKMFNRLVLEMKRKFDYIFIESAALNDRSDSFELFETVDQVITVFSAKSAPAQSDIKSIEAIRSLNEKNFGAVLNMVEYDNMNY